MRIQNLDYAIINVRKKSRNVIEAKRKQNSEKQQTKKVLSAVDELLTSTNRHLQITRAEESATTKTVSTSLLSDVRTDNDRNYFVQKYFNFWLRLDISSSFVPSTNSPRQATQKTNLSVTLQIVQFFNKVDNLKQYGRSRCYYTR